MDNISTALNRIWNHTIEGTSHVTLSTAQHILILNCHTTRLMIGDWPWFLVMPMTVIPVFVLACARVCNWVRNITLCR